MPYISEIYTSKPKEYKSDLEKITFETLEKICKLFNIKATDLLEIQ